MKQENFGIFDWRHIWAIDQNPSWQHWIPRWHGQLSAAIIVGLVLWPHFEAPEIIIIITAALLAARFQGHRALILFAGTWLYELLGAWYGWTDLLTHIETISVDQARLTGQSQAIAWVCTVACLCFLYVALTFSKQLPKSMFSRHPLMGMLLLLSLMLLVGKITTGSIAYVSNLVVLTLAPYVWFIPQAVMAARAGKSGSVLLNLALIRAFWNPTYLPYGKGPGYLEKHQASNAKDVAIAQLKGLKLLVWGLCLYLFNLALANSLPNEWMDLDEAIARLIRGESFSIVKHWAVTMISTTSYSVNVAMWAHFFIGIARLAGYRLPRGSWRPLESRSLADYFNRFHFYFKELLVELFFVPTFFRFFKTSPRLRVFFATFMAAGVGNALWHYVRDIHLVIQGGFVDSISTFTSYLFYCLALSVAIGISQIRSENQPQRSEAWLARLKDFVLVWGFVSLLHIFGNGSRVHGFEDRMLFLGSLFGVYG